MPESAANATRALPRILLPASIGRIRRIHANPRKTNNGVKHNQHRGSHVEECLKVREHRPPLHRSTGRCRSTVMFDAASASSATPVGKQPARPGFERSCSVMRGFLPSLGGNAGRSAVEVHPACADRRRPAEARKVGRKSAGLALPTLRTEFTVAGNLVNAPFRWRVEAAPGGQAIGRTVTR